MKTILLHPSYFPSIEQMAAVAQAESVVFEVEDNYQKQTYRNRTFIAHSNGKLLLNIPIKHNKTGKRKKTKDVIVGNIIGEACRALIEPRHFSSITKMI